MNGIYILYLFDNFYQLKNLSQAYNDKQKLNNSAFSYQKVKRIFLTQAITIVVHIYLYKDAKFFKF